MGPQVHTRIVYGDVGESLRCVCTIAEFFSLLAQIAEGMQPTSLTRLALTRLLRLASLAPPWLGPLRHESGKCHPRRRSAQIERLRICAARREQAATRDGGELRQV